MKKEIITIAVIGKIANDLLHNEQIIKFLNTTSQGAFLKCGAGHIVFLSFEGFHGPLTANLTGINNRLHEISKGDTAAIDKGRLIFIDSQVQINISGAEIWNPTLIDEIQLLNADRRKSRNQNLAQKIIENSKTEGFSALLQKVFEPVEYEKSLNHPVSSNLPDLSRIQHFLVNHDYEKLSQYLENFLGFGPGLTPSGDDFILGVILMINRWQAKFKLHSSYKLLNLRIVAAAKQRTNLISSELIRCASLGQADERLIHAVDYLAGANINMEMVLDGLLNWGNSSGIDAFTGMATVISVMT